jgi:hypothetical protein
MSNPYNSNEVVGREQTDRRLCEGVAVDIACTADGCRNPRPYKRFREDKRHVLQTSIAKMIQPGPRPA